jgi:hypothetical protein
LLEVHAERIAAAATAPAFCRVTGVLAPEIAFEIALPERWNGRFYMIGNGGPAAESLEDPGRVAQRDSALQVGFAFAQTNTGHDGRKEPGYSFVMSNPQKALDYAYRAVNLTAVTAKALTRSYYGKAVARSYWNSCSNGGRQGLIEAQRYPQDFDGALVNSPWVDQTGFTIGALWNQRAVGTAGLTAAKMVLIGKAVMEKCDAADGLKDGLIDDPRQCKFDAKVDVPACAAGADGDACLTASQAEAVMKVYNGPVSNGKPFFPGFMFGSEAVVASVVGGATNVSGWMGIIVPAQPDRKPADFNLAEGIMQYMVHTPPQPQYDYRTFDFDHDIGMLAQWGRKADATATDLSRFRHKGGKLLMTYGWADTILQPLMALTTTSSRSPAMAPIPRIFPAFHGARHGPLWRRHRHRPLRCHDPTDRLGREGQGARYHSCLAGARQSRSPLRSALCVRAGGALHRAGEHRRRREFQLRQPMTNIWARSM